jgi:hypothetical protein
MRNFTQYCSIPHPHLKWPKLEEAVQIICGRDDFEFHDSLADCYAVLEVLKEACFHQPSKFSSTEECQEAAEGILDKFSSATLRAMLRR